MHHAQNILHRFTRRRFDEAVVIRTDDRAITRHIDLSDVVRPCGLGNEGIAGHIPVIVTLVGRKVAKRTEGQNLKIAESHPPATLFVFVSADVRPHTNHYMHLPCSNPDPPLFQLVFYWGRATHLLPLFWPFLPVLYLVTLKLLLSWAACLGAHRLCLALRTTIQFVVSTLVRPPSVLKCMGPSIPPS